MWVEDQNVPILKPNNMLFEREFKLDLSDERQLRKMYKENVIKQITVIYLLYFII
jgi:hypothetical protein